MTPLDPSPLVPRDSRGHRAEGLDDIDYRIIALLRQDGRMPFRSIAQELELTEATVRFRVRRMEDSNSMRVVAVTDIEAAGFSMLLAIGVEVEGRSPSVVAEQLAEIDEVFSVSVVIGSHDIEILAVARDQDQLDQLLGRLAAVTGVRRLLPSLAVNVLKNQPHWVPFSDDLSSNESGSGDLSSGEKPR